MSTFRKQEDCPTSQELLSYQLGDIPPGSGRIIGRHLAVCEFCSSEVEFYEHYPVSKEVEDEPETVDMPKPLLQLAEAILNQKHAARSIAEIMKEVDPTPLDRR